MIPIKVDAATRERYVQNVVDAYEASTLDQRTRGAEWYHTAHELAEMLSDGNPAKGAGVIAALSANKSWADNQRLATNAMAGHIGGHFKDALTKVAAIIAGADPASVLPMERKTGHFYRCIVNPNDEDAVVIDRHAHDIAVGEIYGNRDRGLSAGGRYALLAHVYREAALRLNERPSVVQATVWVAHIDRKDAP